MSDGLVGLLFILAILGLVCGAGTWLWNTLLTGVAGVPPVNIFEFLGLAILARILLGAPSSSS